MKFSVLMSLYAKEQPEFLRQSLESIFHQTVPPNEVILVEDGPVTTELLQVLEEFKSQHSELKVYPFQQNRGLGPSLNDGLAYCSYELVARMDTDDMAKPSRFEEQLQVFMKMTDVDVCSSWIDEFIDDKEHLVSVRKLPENNDEIREFAKKRNPISHPVVMFKKSAVIKAGGYKSFPLFEDYYLWVRMMMSGAKMYNIQKSLLYFRATREMFARRGGWSYAFSEIRFQWTMYRLGFIPFSKFVKNEMVRFPIRLIPNRLRRFVYATLIHKR